MTRQYETIQKAYSDYVESAKDRGQIIGDEQNIVTLEEYFKHIYSQKYRNYKKLDILFEKPAH